MAAAARLILVTLTVCHLSVLAHKDCPVLVTGPDHEWTPTRRLEWMPSAPSIDPQFPGPPPGRNELSFSVQTGLSGLEIHLSSARYPGGYLLHVNSRGWVAQRTFVGAVFTTLASGRPPPDQVTAADEWSSYAVSVSGPDSVQLQRLYDNGTRQLWLELRHPWALSVDSASARVTLPQSERRRSGQGSGISPEASGDWGFWKFDCSRFYYQTAKLCHLWPSWPSDVPLRFRTPNRRRISPVNSVNVLVSANGTIELHLLETPQKFYLVTLTSAELTLGRSEPGVSAVRQVARACLAPQSPPPRFRLLWVSILRGFINIGLDDTRPCVEDDEEATQAPATSEAAPAQTGMTTVGPVSGSEEVTEMTPEVSEVTVGQMATTTPTPVRTALVSWQDSIPYNVMSYGVRTPDDQGVWTVGCQPIPDPAIDGDKRDQLPTRGIFNLLTTSDQRVDADRGDTGAGRRCRTQQQFLLATVVLAVVSVVLLLVAVLLATALLSQRRRWSAELAVQRRLSLVGTDLFSTAAVSGDDDHQYAELSLYDRVRPMSLRPGESTFKPVRRQPTPETNVYETVPVLEEAVPVLEEAEPVLEEAVPVLEETKPVLEEPVPMLEEPVLEETVPVLEERPEARESSVEPLPPPPENI